MSRNSQGILPLVSVGLPVYNAAITVGDAIRSVLAQTYANWELIIVDDGSHDGSLRITRAFDDERIQVIEGGENQGLSARLNEIAVLAAGKYVARLDADDMMHPLRLERQVEYLEANPEVDVVGTAIYSVDEEDQVCGKRAIASPCTSVSDVFDKWHVIHATILAKREWFRANPYDCEMKRAQDIDLWCRTVETSVFASLPEALYFCREQGGTDARDYLRKYLGARRAQYRLLWKYGPDAIGLPRTLLRSVTRWLKGEAYRIATHSGIQSLLIARRNSGMSPEEAEAASSVIREMKAYRAGPKYVRQSSAET